MGPEAGRLRRHSSMSVWNGDTDSNGMFESALEQSILSRMVKAEAKRPGVAKEKPGAL